jgi:hypothetical protein
MRPGAPGSPIAPPAGRPPGPAGIVAGAFDGDSWRTAHADRTWIFDGRAIVPVLKTRAVEEDVGTRPFASIGDALRKDPGLAASRAVLFEVAPPGSSR